ncbi:MAG: Type I phosphodiesterase / nucleotide pyrophosphatase [candidate division BRC1 bacterium ADurb.BinA364]|nr:MAG: Type I phosphodiesterase / nucleotide pyrophosphatase [candidate division BRC1 bacterium ADurb.BinA364]
MSKAKKLAVVGFDSISLPFLETFVKRGVMPTVKRLMETGCVTQTWPCFPMETATNWACLATGASPAVHGCNMGMPAPGGPLGTNVQAFPADFIKAEQLWSAARRGGKRSIVFDWTQSYPLAFEDGLIHVGEDGRPHLAIRALQEVCAYTTNETIPASFHVQRIQPAAAEGWAAPAPGALEFEMPIVPTNAKRGGEPSLPNRYNRVESLWARVEKGAAGYERVSVFSSKSAASPLFSVRLGEWSDWARHGFAADGEIVEAHIRGKLLKLSPDGADVHLYLSEIYPASGFSHPAALAAKLVEACGPYVIQCSRQQVVISNASDIETYFQEQEYMGEWYRKAAGFLLNSEEWDLFMFKWHGPDWTNHLTMYMIDEEHAMYDPARAAEGWAYWDRLMGLGDRIVQTVIDAAGPEAAIALVSDHGGATSYNGKSPKGAQTILREMGLAGGDGKPMLAHAFKHYVHINVKGRRPGGVVEPDSAEYHALRERIIDALLDAKDENGRHAFRAVLPIEDAARLGVAGDFAGDIFTIPAEAQKPTREEWLELHPDPAKRGTWDWPRMNSGAHCDDSYFVIHGPGLKRGYRRQRPALITSVAPTIALELGIPVPKHADGAALWDFFE